MGIFPFRLGPDKRKEATPYERLKASTTWILVEVIENLQKIMWYRINASVRRFIKTFIEHLLAEEFTVTAGADRYKRSTHRKIYGDEHYIRRLLIKYGLIERIRAPRIDKDLA